MGHQRGGMERIKKSKSDMEELLARYVLLEPWAVLSP